MPQKARVIFTVAIYTGLRAGELWGLRWTDLDCQRAVIHVARSYRDAPKGGKTREVPMLAPVLEALSMWKEECPRALGNLVFASAWDADMHRVGYDADFGKYVVRVTNRDVRFHDMRHTCASHLLQGSWAPSYLERPLRLEEVRDWLGHEDIKTTQRYAHLSADAVQSLVRRNPPRNPAAGEIWSHLRDLNSRPTVYETVALPLS